MTTVQWGRPSAGREPAAAALLAWLADPAAPRMCLITGSAGCGKSTLLAWLVAHGTRPETPQNRRVHAVAPLQGLGVRGAVWTLANQLGVVARAPAELAAALAADRRPITIVLPDLQDAADTLVLADMAAILSRLEHVRVIVEATASSLAATHLADHAPAVMNLDHDQWTDPERLAAWQRAHHRPTPLRTTHAEPSVNLDDPEDVCAADPITVTARYESSNDEHTGLRTAWLRAGQALLHEPQPAARALALLSALGDSADPRLKQHLTTLAANADWSLVWNRVTGDIRPPWPGPALALAAGHGVLAGTVLTADHEGVIRIISAENARASGRLPRAFTRTQALAALPDGTVLALDVQGRLTWQHSPAVRRPSGISALLDDGPTPVQQLIDTMSNHLAQIPGRTLTATSHLLAVADDAGAVHAATLHQPTGRPQTAALFEGPVTALAALDLNVPEDGTPISLLYSGGADGHVRAWSPGRAALTPPVMQRPFPVTALAAMHTEDGPALAVGWGDGLVEHHTWDRGTTRVFRPGPPVRSLTATDNGDLVVGCDDMLVCLRPR
ncbi:hypothetical protein ABT269_22580 [Streptomyces viridosporus]|uniref:hypothetical protein n=1 Tax=Streptomyces viridosporus TaxID=67581 RepID=UPI00331C43A6